jgi:hypothetical protein
MKNKNIYRNLLYLARRFTAGYFIPKPPWGVCHSRECGKPELFFSYYSSMNSSPKNLRQSTQSADTLLKSPIFFLFLPFFSSFFPQNSPVLHTFLFKTNPILKMPKLIQSLLCQAVMEIYLRNLQLKMNPNEPNFTPIFDPENKKRSQIKPNFLLIWIN